MSKELKALAEKATPGPWVSFIRPSVQAVFGPDGVQPDSQGTVVNWPGFDSSDQTKMQRKANARYIAAANPAVILQLLAEVEALREDAERYRWLIDSGNDTYSMFVEAEDKAALDAAIDAAMRGEL